MIDFVQCFLGLRWWLRLLRRSPGRALIVLLVELIAAAVLIVGMSRLADPRLDVLLIVVVAALLAAFVLWADLTAPALPHELPTGPDEWAPPSAETVNRVIGGTRGDGPPQ